ncbi:MAG: ATP-binding cassette domain-containing protein, partial [Brachybacterium tyrofermentans]
PASRIDEVLDEVGAQEYADRRIGTFSTGMRQRLALATALLGEPEMLVLDEPTNGLDPAGIAWLRSFVRTYAERGGTVLLSSHALGEVQRAIDDVVLIDRGRVARSGPLGDLLATADSLESAFLQATRAGVAA